MSNPHTVFRATMLAILLIPGCSSNEQTTLKDDPSTEIAPVFSKATPLLFRMELPFSTLYDNREAIDISYANAYIVHEAQSVPILIKTRGRTSVANCQFPKLKIKFDSSHSSNVDKVDTFLDNSRAIKIGTHCDHRYPGQNQIGTELAVKREQLVYQLYRTGSLPAFRTRLAKIDYIDTDNQNESLGSKDAFLLENIKDVAERWSYEEIEFSDEQENRLPDIPVWRSKLQKNATVSVILKHIMLLTTDWNIMGLNRHHSASIRNTKFLQSPSGLIPVPYDFDLAFAINDNMESIIHDLSKAISEVPDDFYPEESGLVRSQLWLLKEQETNFLPEVLASQLREMDHLKNSLQNTINNADVSSQIKANFKILVDGFYAASALYLEGQ